MQCPSCRADNRDGRRFCGSCGAALPALCPACGFANEPDDRFCGGCGRALASGPAPPPALPASPVAPPPTPAPTGPSAPGPTSPAGERRQVTVLFADLSGYTRLASQLDAEEMHGLLERFFTRVDRIVEGFGGSIDKHIGDCVMAVFGAPLAHDDDADRAARAALAIRDDMSRLGEEVGRQVEVHQGIASGQVVASGTGSDSHRSYTVTGDSVNLAARLTDAAGAGEIMLSDGVRRLVRTGCTLVEAGDLQLDGFADPIRAWRLDGLAPTGPVGDRPFVGRRAELAQFEGLLRACRDGGVGQTIHVRGEAGIGKTRLVEEFRSLAVAADFACHTGLVLDFGVAAGQDAVRTLARSLVGLGGSSDPTLVDAAAERALDLVGADHEVFLNDLLDRPQHGSLRALYDAMDYQTRNRGKLATFAELVGEASRRQPLLVVVEDMHWADRIVLEYLATLARKVAARPALLVMTSRVEGDPIDPAWRQATGGGALLTLDLGPLRASEAEALAAAFPEAGDEVTRRCVARAAGNPLFLEQLLRHAEADAGAVPASIRSLVQARLDQLTPTDKHAVQAASVLGQRFEPDALHHLLASPDYACTGPVAHHLVRWSGDQLMFAHALIRDAVYDTLLKSRRRELHGRAAAWFLDQDAMLHAEHLDRADDPGAPQAYLRAARRQAALYRYERARQLAERGLSLTATPAVTFELTCCLGDLLLDLGDMTGARAAFERALEVAGSDEQRCRAWLGLAGVKRVTDDLDGAFAELDQAQAAAERLDLGEPLAQILFLRGNLHFPRGEIEGCLGSHRRSLGVARRIGSTRLEAQALGGLGDAEYARGRMMTAHHHFRDCVELCREHGFGRIEVANSGMLAHSRLYFLPQSEALEIGLTAAAAAAEVGHLRAEINARAASIFALFTLADLARLREQAALLTGLVERIRARRFLQSSLLHLGKASLLDGDRAEAIRLLHEALDISHHTGLTFHGPNIIGALAVAVEDAGERRRLLAEGEAIIRQGSVSHNPLRFYPDAIDVALDLGDWDEAERYARALEEFTHPEPLPWADLFAARGRALAAVGRGQHDDALLARLRRLHADAERLEIMVALPALDSALAGTWPVRPRASS
jgi:class 3 adenylate cyclase/tetratricopeptide (TPR) repeat protein